MAWEEGHAKAERTGAAGCRGDGVPSTVKYIPYQHGRKAFSLTHR